MRIRGLIYLSVAMLVSSVVCTLWLLQRNDLNNQVDIVAANEIVKLVERHWPSVEASHFQNSDEAVFSVIDAKGGLIYQSHQEADSSLNEALKNRSIILDVIVEGEAVGKVLIYDSYESIVQEVKQQLIIALLLIFTMIALFLVMYIIYIHRVIFKPFKQLEQFAQHVARGNLDIPLHMMKNNPFGAFTESFDMMREELAAARQSEYEANRSKKELVASLSHDIKTPVSTIKAVSELMLLRAEDEKSIKQLNTILSKSEQIHLLVTDMFHATLEELNELKVIVTEEPSTALVPMIESVNYDNRIRCGDITECMLLTDLNRLQQVIDNVVSNAYKYAGTSVAIEAQMNNEFLELHISDYGPGIKEDEIPLMFNKFYRGSNAEGHSGSGLGLYISKYLMNKTKGHIYGFNHENGFTVVLQIKMV